jgi:hypothetical protein
MKILFLQLFSFFMLYLDFLLFTLLLFSQLLKLLLNEKCDILEKSCRHKIFMISDCNGVTGMVKKSSGVPFMPFLNDKFLALFSTFW